MLCWLFPIKNQYQPCFQPHSTHSNIQQGHGPSLSLPTDSIVTPMAFWTIYCHRHLDSMGDEQLTLRHHCDHNGQLSILPSVRPYSLSISLYHYQVTIVKGISGQDCTLWGYGWYLIVILNGRLVKVGGLQYTICQELSSSSTNSSSSSSTADRSF